jgi:hypothetical protein
MTQAERIEIEALLCRAAQTLLAMPDARPGGFRSFWPDIVRKASESFGTDAMRDRFEVGARPTPTAQDIDELDRVLEAVLKLTPLSRRIVWARALHADWNWIVLRLRWTGHNRDKRTWQRRYDRALNFLVAEMSQMSHIPG